MVNKSMQSALRFAQDTSKYQAKYPAPQGIPQIPFRDQGKRNRGEKLAINSAKFKKQKKKKMRILVTGGAGFIGSNFIKHILTKYPDYEVVNLDKLTYSGNLENLKDVENNPNYRFIKGDICDAQIVEKAIEGCDAIVNFAAESHVDR
ncbi:GDP-mannose 4,6-dehydratase, partial [bacterium]|nr:GDP-mannose 4,6-dehydratase [bacterium]